MNELPMPPLILVTADDRVRQLIERAAERDGAKVVCVGTPGELVLAASKCGMSAAVVDLANQSVNGEALAALSGVADVHDVPLILVSRQKRREVMPLAKVVGARDVISTAESRDIVAGRLRLWMTDTHHSMPMLGLTA